MWILYAFLSAIFAGITAILAKIGIKNVESDVATAVRTVVVLIFSWVMVLVAGSFDTIYDVNLKSWIFLILSGIATGASWLCYFKALQIGDVNKVTPIDKSSTILTIILAVIFLGEPLTIIKAVAVVLIGIGTYLMIQKKEGLKEVKNNKWIVFALFSAIFASLTSILAKVGIEGVESNLGTAIRTVVVLIMAWIVVFVTKKQSDIHNIDKKNLIFICLSGLATGASWLCYYRALKDGQASVVVPIDKLSILITVGFSYVFLKEKLSKKSILGLCLIVAGTLTLLV